MIEKCQFTKINRNTEGQYGVIGRRAVFHSKGQIKLKADWRAIDSPKKRTNKFVFLP
jgi:hypothetical protein